MEPEVALVRHVRILHIGTVRFGLNFVAQSLRKETHPVREIHITHRVAITIIYLLSSQQPVIESAHYELIADNVDIQRGAAKGKWKLLLMFLKVGHQRLIKRSRWFH